VAPPRPRPRYAFKLQRPRYAFSLALQGPAPRRRARRCAFNLALPRTSTGGTHPRPAPADVLDSCSARRCAFSNSCVAEDSHHLDFRARKRAISNSCVAEDQHHWWHHLDFRARRCAFSNSCSARRCAFSNSCVAEDQHSFGSCAHRSAFSNSCSASRCAISNSCHAEVRQHFGTFGCTHARGSVLQFPTHVRGSVPQFPTAPNAGASVVHPWICLRFTLSGLLSTALMSLYCACNARERFCASSHAHIRSPTYLLSLFNVMQITAAFAFLNIFGSSTRSSRPSGRNSITFFSLSLGALSMVLVFVEKCLGWVMYPSDGAQVWARLGGYYLSWFSGNLDAPARDTGCLQWCPCHFVSGLPTLCCHS
jgi:hypothetical protein